MQVMTEIKTLPKLRFGEFQDEWKKQSLGKLTVKVNKKNKDNISYPIYSINNVEGFLPQSEQFEGLDSNDRNYDISIYKIVQPKTFAYNPARINVGSIGYSYDLSNIIISSLYICFKTKEELNDSYLGIYLKTYNFNMDILRYQEGGVRQYLFYENFSMIKIPLPSLKEQQKIASFLSTVDKKFQQLTKKKELLEEYKKGVMQKIFSQEIRFKDANGNYYPDWEEKKLGEVLFEHKLKSTGKEEVYSVSVHKGLINQIEHLGRSFSAKNTDHYNLVKPNDIIYTKSPTGQFPYGIIKQAKINKDVIVSPLYGVFTPQSKHLGYMFDIYFESKNNVRNYLYSIVQKGAKNTINITNSNFLSKSLKLPIDFDEQRKIGNFLKSIDNKIELVSTQIENTQSFKKGLSQQMFV